MKRLFKTVFCAVVCMLAVSNVRVSVAATQSLDYRTVEEAIYTSETTADLRHVKAVADSHGNLYVVFNNGHGGISYFATNRTGAWVIEELVSLEENEGVAPEYPAIAIDSNDVLHVVFTQYKDKLIYGTRSTRSSKWNLSEVNNNNTPNLLRFYIMEDYIDMCVDDGGGVHLLAFAEGRNQQDVSFDVSSLYFHKPPGGPWSNELLMQGEVNTRQAYGLHPSIATSGEMLFASFGGYSSINFAQKRVGAAAWETENLYVTDFMNGGKFETSLCIDPHGSPVFAYYDYYGEDNPHYGLNVVSRSSCAGSWQIDDTCPDKTSLRNPAIGIDDDGMAFLAVGGLDLRLFRRACNCQRSWREIYHDPQVNSDYTDLVVDNQNQIHVFYSYENSVYHLKCWCEGDTAKNCNARPSISFEGDLNTKPGQRWSGTFYAHDPECDPVELYTIITNPGWELTDHGNGSATLSGTVSPDVDGIGEGAVVVTVFCNDDQHPGPNGFQANATIHAKITPEGEEEGSVDYRNNCWSRRDEALK